MSVDSEITRSPPSDSDGTRKRKRALKACVICHQRKIKCDLDFKEVGQRCTNCEELNLECELYKRKKRIKKFQIHKNLSDLLERTKIETLNAVRIDPAELMQKLKKTRHHEYIYKSYSDAENRLVTRLFDEYTKEQQFQDVSDASIRNLNLLGCFNLPEKAVCQSYVDSYFQNVHPLIPILNKETFLAENSKYTNPTSLLLLQTVLFAGSKFIKCESEESKLTQSKITNILYGRAKALFDHDFEGNAINLLAAMALLGLGLEDHYFHTKSLYSWLQVSISVANSHGFFQNDLSEYTEKEQCQIRKLTWYLISKDTVVSVILGKPRLIDVSTVPSEKLSLRDFRFDTDITDTIKLYAIEHLRLAEALAAVDQTVVNGSAGLPSSEQDTLLGMWFDTVPNELKLGTHTQKNPNYHSLIICCNYFCTLTTLHHASIVHSIATKPPSDNLADSHRPSWEVIFQCCITVDTILKELKNTAALSIFGTEIIIWIFLLGKVLTYFLRASDQSVAKRGREIADNLLDILENGIDNWNLTQKFHHVLSKLFNDENIQDELLRIYVGPNHTGSEVQFSQPDVPVKLEKSEADASFERAVFQDPVKSCDPQASPAQRLKKISIASLISPPDAVESANVQDSATGLWNYADQQ
ncbi:hypothetical protein KL918_003085 [Ogataea parapolymorpha]|uniref:Cutinase transcription factor 1 alpha n=1 Tax=Ogataea parapolymorpha (strain ATCC 26012 / BCRC 20466 / JCM 22074 / NRRL Y-7560 / DL-1) TaxID=871575 RepID=W1QDD3_OGAPD|nr:Cutinase transcription factor 1 alpha [Ogataea parapolymorpha DL-1]ESW97707.1 Cutinase transcription factor 1 alpha [Ogataea parapolymorpha DL-1]KAG7866890.1 hypothetical protein KL918_003085 [Ogataea parapolymorpha]KAG7871220.1 hypothetical protein KL916_004219 [Ogataea parapolymorpha]KAG7882613.1 hypothetical protein KL938_003036 [Ogataea parapolymorpha]